MRPTPPAPCTCPAAPGCPCDDDAMRRYHDAVRAAAVRFTVAVRRAQDDSALGTALANEGAALDSYDRWVTVAQHVRFCPVAHLQPCLARYEARRALTANPLVIADAPRRAAAILARSRRATPIEAARAGRFLADVTPEGLQHPVALALLTRAYASPEDRARRFILERVDVRTPTDVLLALVAAATSDEARLAVLEAAWQAEASVWWAVYGAWSDPATVGTLASAALQWPGRAPDALATTLLNRMAHDAAFTADHFPRVVHGLAPAAVVPRLRAALGALDPWAPQHPARFETMAGYLAQAPLEVLMALAPDDLTPFLAADDVAFRAFALALLPAIGPTGRELPERPEAPVEPLPF